MPLGEPLRWVRWLGLWMVLASLLGRGLHPALQGVASDRVMRAISLVAGLSSQGLLWALGGGLIWWTAGMLRLAMLPMSYRMGVTALGGVVLGLAVPAGVTKLAPAFNVGLAVAAALAALAGAAQALAPRETRILGVGLVLAAAGALTRQTSLVLVLAGGAKALRNVALVGLWVAGAALLLQGVLVAFGLWWLSTRRARWLSLATPLCSALALAASWLAEPAAGPLASWKLVVARAASQYLAAPAPPAPPGIQVFLAVAGLLMALLAVAHRREAPAVAGGWALLLVSGLDLDVPLCALGVTVTALVATLAAHDPETLRHPITYDLT
ncbi:MAG: hypothetical protein RMJ98_12665 [Myxococcales bacterium]|nr:hypothetical protein [Polyangiaceae bacterium]MDW8250139.1 hypothetical protein [Myxococcales bacterium]